MPTLISGFSITGECRRTSTSRIVIPVVVGSSPISHPTECVGKSKGYMLRLVTLFFRFPTGFLIFQRAQGCGTNLQPQCLQIRASFITSSLQSGHLTWVRGDGADLSFSTDGITATAIRLNGPNSRPSRNQMPAKRALLLATIQQRTALPNQTNANTSIISLRQNDMMPYQKVHAKNAIGYQPVQTSALASQPGI